MTTAAAIALLLPAIPVHYHDQAKLLIRFEGLRTAAYQDSAGHWTIGVGHRLKVKGLGADGAPIRWSIATIASALEEDINRARHYAVFNGWSDLSWAQRSALGSLAFNVGDIRGSKLLALI